MCVDILHFICSWHLEGEEWFAIDSVEENDDSNRVISAVCCGSDRQTRGKARFRGALSIAACMELLLGRPQRSKDE